MILERRLFSGCLFQTDPLDEIHAQDLFCG